MKTTNVWALLPFTVLCLNGGCDAESRTTAREIDTTDTTDTSTETESETDEQESDTEPDAAPDTDDDTAGSPGCQKIDILFIIDDSGSMECEQTMLVQAFPGFIEVLEQYNNDNEDQISYRIGVTSTGHTVSYTQNVPGIGSIPWNAKGMDGALASVSGLSDQWIDGPGDQATLTAKFADMASLGTGGPGYEMPLLCMSMAIEKSAPGEANEGFLREEAMFVAVVITDEDDCSRLDDDFTIGIEVCSNFPEKHNLMDLEEFKIVLDERFGGPQGYVFVAIAGRQSCDATAYPSSCDGDDESFAGASRALRLQNFVNQYVGPSAGANSLFADICTTSLPDALAAALEKIEVACDAYVPPAT